MTAVALVAAYVALRVAMSGGPHDPASDRVDIAGDDVSHAGGRKITVRQAHRAFSLTCRDGCDDVSLVGRGEVKSVVVAGPEGRVIEEREAGLFAPKAGTAWAVSGQPKLSIERRRP